MYFFKQHKLNRLYKKQEKLKRQLQTCTNKAKHTVLETKFRNLNYKISNLEHAIRYNH